MDVCVWLRSAAIHDVVCPLMSQRLLVLIVPNHKERMSWPGWLVTNQDGLPVRRQSPLPVVTGLTESNFADRDQSATIKPNCQHINELKLLQLFRKRVPKVQSHNQMQLIIDISRWTINTNQSITEQCAEEHTADRLLRMAGDVHRRTSLSAWLLTVL